MEVDHPGAAGVSDRGLEHYRNEDSVGVLDYVFGHERGVVAVVCDGISNSPRPDRASQAAVDVGTEALVAHLRAGYQAGEATKAAVASAGKAVSALATSPADAPACTYVSAIVERDVVTVGWVGDSRAYWLAADARTQSVVLTKDDSLVNHLSETGEMTHDEARRQPNGGALVKWLGADAEDIRPRIVSCEPGAPGAVLICSDGLWKYLPQAEALAAAVPGAAKAPMAAARSLVQLALDAGGHDNVTVVVIPYPPEGGHRG
ncbi:protein phosphatase 2C domain-containing protein [Actinopolymorpha sp. B17G11]|uniref:PP2C family protein-serine/threonine phosphatase n=1 Tax=unclassified Actinopolymorpha TaxID=2627063 RepID=UPI0032D9723B